MFRRRLAYGYGVWHLALSIPRPAILPGSSLNLLTNFEFRSWTVVATTWQTRDALCPPGPCTEKVVQLGRGQQVLGQTLLFAASQVPRSSGWVWPDRAGARTSAVKSALVQMLI